MAKILRKLTIASTGWTKGAIQAALFAAASTPGQAPADGDSIELMKIVGVTTMARPGQTDKGEYLKLIGEFTAINMDDSEIFTASSCILPNFISDSLAAALATSPQVEFALLIGAEASAKSVSGYVFTVTPLVEAKPSNAMAALLELVAAPAQPALAAPEPAVKKAKK